VGWPGSVERAEYGQRPRPGGAPASAGPRMYCTGRQQPQRSAPLRRLIRATGVPDVMNALQRMPRSTGHVACALPLAFVPMWAPSFQTTSLTHIRSSDPVTACDQPTKHHLVAAPPKQAGLCAANPLKTGGARVVAGVRGGSGAVASGGVKRIHCGVCGLYIGLIA